MTHRAWVLLLPLAVVSLHACSGGGGSSSVPPVAAWPKFRHDSSNTGQASGAIAAVTPIPLPILIDENLPPDKTPGPVSASPAIALDGTVYVGSEGGTLKALTAKGDPKWSITSCSVCPPTDPPTVQSLGPLVSSPAVYTLNSLNQIFVGSDNGNFYVFDDAGNTATCVACFQPRIQDSNVKSASFVSSPTFTVHPITGNITGIYVGASVVDATTGSVVGKLYAINGDGTLKWEYPRPGAEPIAPVTSSPAIGFGDNLHFIANDGMLYTLTKDGDIGDIPFNLLSDIRRGTCARDPGPVNDDPDNLPTVSAVAGTTEIFANTASGFILGIPPGGATGDCILIDERFAGSLVLGSQALALTPTPTPTSTRPITVPTSSTPAPSVPPDQATATPSPTATPITPTVTPTAAQVDSTLFGITRQGTVVVVDALTGMRLSFDQPDRPDPEVLSSPAISSDGYLVFGSNGKLYAINSSSGLFLPGWQIPLGDGLRIRSSPAIASDGTVWIGADDGNLYRVGTP